MYLGQVIGFVSNTGRSTGPHLIMNSGVQVNPRRCGTCGQGRNDDEHPRLRFPGAIIVVQTRGILALLQALPVSNSEYSGFNQPAW